MSFFVCSTISVHFLFFYSTTRQSQNWAPSQILSRGLWYSIRRRRRRKMYVTIYGRRQASPFISLSLEKGRKGFDWVFRLSYSFSILSYLFTSQFSPSLFNTFLFSPLEKWENAKKERPEVDLHSRLSFSRP